MEGYTKISVEVKYHDGEISRVEASSNAWDLDGEKVGDMFEQLMLAMGFHPDTVASVFRGDEDVYAEAADLPCCEPCLDGHAVTECEPPCGEPLSKVFADEDPCCCCDEECDDTACLHENDAGPICADRAVEILRDYAKSHPVPRGWHDDDGDNE